MPRAGAAGRPYPGYAPWRPNAERAAYFATVGSDYISFADPPRVVDNSTDFCIEIVIRPRATMGVYDTPISKHTLTQGLYFSTNNPATKVFFAIDDVDVGLTFPLASVGEARYYCVSYINSTLYGYSAPYDGTQTQTLSTVGTAFPAAPTTTNAAIEIGGLSAQAVYGVGYAGEILWARWWNKGLPESTLARIWNRRLIPGEKAPPGLAFWWDAAIPRRDLVTGLIGTINGTVALSSTYGYPKYFISPRDPRLNLPLTSIEASGAASATGSPSLPFFNAAGTGVQTQSSSGAASLPKLNAAGQAVMIPSATGTPSLPFINAAGVAVQTQAATGTPSLPFLSAAGAATFGTAAAGSGTPSLPFLNVAGVAVMLPSATGAPSLPFLSAAGSALHTQAASGAPALPFFNVAGVAVFGSAATASGTPSLPFINTTGTALQTQSASGTPSLPFLSAAGSAIFGSAAAATGTPSLPFMNTAGVAVERQSASGTPSLPFLAASGVAVQIPKATGAPSLPFMASTGAATITYTATGAANLPRLGAAGSAFFGDALGVIATALARWAPVVSANARYARDATASARNE